MDELEEKKISKKKAVRYGALAAVGCSVVTGVAAVAITLHVAGVPSEMQSLVNSMKEIQSIVDKRFVGEYTMDSVEDYALTGYVEGLGDRWSYYMTPEAFEQYKKDNEDTRTGVGVSVSPSYDKNNEVDALVVQTVSVGSPAEKAGFGSYDRIIKVNGKTIKQLGGYNETVDAVRGESSTEVTLTYEDYDTGKTVDCTLTRAEFEQIYVTSHMIGDSVGYIKIDRFASETDEQFVQELKSLQKQGAEKLVFDLRDNPGGSLDSLVNCLDPLLPEGKIITLKSKSGKTEEFTSDAEEVDLPMAVIVNEDSYSAAEFFAEALREYDKAEIVGEKTCGKGYSQITYELSNGGAIGLSSNCYYTPNGNSLIGVGVEPDVTCSLTKKQEAKKYVLTDEEDPQIQAALKTLK